MIFYCLNGLRITAQCRKTNRYILKVYNFKLCYQFYQGNNVIGNKVITVNMLDRKYGSPQINCDINFIHL